MKNIALEVENLSKQYRLGQVGTGTLSHDLNRWWHKIRARKILILKLVKLMTELNREIQTMYGHFVMLILK